MISWLLSLFEAHRQLQRECDDAKREAGHERAVAAAWQARWEKANDELIDELRGSAPAEDKPTVELPPSADSGEPPQLRRREQGRKVVKRREREFFAAQIAKVNGARD